MTLDPQWILAFLTLGVVVGFVAGLLGIGGGGIMVPVLSSIFLWQGLPVDNVIHLALGTSMASIVLTSLSSMRAHHAQANVLWPVVRAMAPGIIVGTFATTFLAANTKPIYLAAIFASFMAYVAVQMFANRKPQPSRTLVGKGGLFSAGLGIGGISALVSIGGGSLTVPFLHWQNIDIKKAIGTSAAVGFPISLAGSLGYAIHGWSSPVASDYTFGFVYLPAVVLISIPSYFMAPVGARMAHRLPIPILKKLFAVLLAMLSLKMLSSVL